MSIDRHSSGPDAAGAVGTAPSADKPGSITAVIHVRPHAILARLGLGAKGKAAALSTAWVEGMGVPLNTVRELTLVCTAEGVRMRVRGDHEGPWTARRSGGRAGTSPSPS